MLWSCLPAGGDDFDAAFEDVVGILENDLGLAAPKSLPEQLGEVFLNGGEAAAEEILALRLILAMSCSSWRLASARS